PSSCLPTLPRLVLFPGTAPSAIYPLSLHDALPIFDRRRPADLGRVRRPAYRHDVGVELRGEAPVELELGLAELPALLEGREVEEDRKSTRLNSSHVKISYAVFCLKK